MWHFCAYVVSVQFSHQQLFDNSLYKSLLCRRTYVSRKCLNFDVHFRSHKYDLLASFRHPGEPFWSQKWPKGVGVFFKACSVSYPCAMVALWAPKVAPKVPQGSPRDPQRHPKGAPGIPKGTPRPPQGTKRHPKAAPEPQNHRSLQKN